MKESYIHLVEVGFPTKWTMSSIDGLVPLIIYLFVIKLLKKMIFYEKMLKKFFQRKDNLISYWEDLLSVYLVQATSGLGIY